MIIGDRLRELRVAKQLSQGDIEKRTGLLRCYVSRVENGHTVPAIETLEKMAQALEVPMYQLFYDGDEKPDLAIPNPVNGNQWGTSGREARYLLRLRKALARMPPGDRTLLFQVIQRMAGRQR
ncbi:MAG TPA: helix-turn-helix transcriptional regulator [Candidatus Sulfotelmatobacter sp.]|nr:helix-turn-helix transcriptional regulator [Candidatus Sulfotelmatobacter sp.]